MNHILVVDDEPLMRTWLSKSIPKHSTCFDVPNTAQDGIEAIDYLKQAAYDVVITDIKMPGMDGLNLAKFIQENYPDTVVIIISGFNDFAYARKAIQYGVKDYLLKPLVDDDLIKLLNDISKRLQKHTPTLLANPTEEERSNPRAMLFRAILEDDSDGIYQGYKVFSSTDTDPMLPYACVIQAALLPVARDNAVLPTEAHSRNYRQNLAAVSLCKKYNWTPFFGNNGDTYIVAEGETKAALMLMTLALCLTLLPAPAWAEEDTPEIGATVQQEQQEAQQEAPAAEPSTILEQAAENGIAAQNGGGSTVENAVAEVTVNGSTTTQYTDIDAAFAAAQEADSATVKLLADVTISHDDYSGIALKKGNITLDLNGKTLSKSKRDDNWFYAKNAVFWLLPPEATTKDEFLAALRMPVRLTVQDSSADENGKIVQPNGGPAVTATLNTILTVNGGTIENASSVDLDDDSHMKPNCAVLLSGGSKAVINGGTLSGMRGVAVTGYITKETERSVSKYEKTKNHNSFTHNGALCIGCFKWLCGKRGKPDGTQPVNYQLNAF